MSIPQISFNLLFLSNSEIIIVHQFRGSEGSPSVKTDGAL